MTCGPQPATFRIIDANSYWSVDAQRGGPITGLVIGDDIELVRTGGIGDADVVTRFPPRWLARGCGACTWWLASPCGLVRLVGTQWVPAEPCARDARCPSAVAASAHRVAVLDPGRGDLRVFAGDGKRLVGELALSTDGPIALAGDGTLLVVDGASVRRFDRDGRELATWGAPAAIDRIAVASDGTVWVAVPAAAGWTVFRRQADTFVEATRAELLASFPATALVAATVEAFCLELPAGGAAPARACYDREGCPYEGTVAPPAPPTYEPAGSLVFGRIDSGMPRCVWHRLRIDVDLPARTSIAVAVAAVEDPDAVLVDADWQAVEVGAADFLIDQPSGRYLRIKLVLHGDGFATPSVHRLRADFPRSTSAEWLPAVYREDPAGRDFLDRFMALFDASLEDIDRVIERFPVLLDGAAVPDEVLAWLASVVGVALDPGIAPERRRALIAAAPMLFRKRGTPEGLHAVLSAAFGVDAAIEELGTTTPFQRLGTAALGTTRLFGRGRTRATLGMSALGATRIRAFGDPLQDARGQLAYRVRIQVPPTPELAGPNARERVMRLVEANKPAHVVAEVRLGGGVPLLGGPFALGIDTALIGVEPSRLGSTTRLNRRTVLAPGGSRAGASISIGRDTIVGASMTLR